MPRKINQYPTGKKILVPQKLNVPVNGINVPPHHPSIVGVQPNLPPIEREMPQYEPSPAKPLNLALLKSSAIRRSRHITIGITTFNRPNHLMRLLQSMVGCTESGILRRIELIVADDGSTRENRIILENYLRNLTAEYSINMTYMYGERRGVSKNKNRCIHAFLTNPMSSELLLLDDDVMFMNGKWWEYIESLSDNEHTGHFGSMPWHINALASLDYQATLPAEVKQPLRGPGEFDITNQTFGHILWVRRDWLLNVKYMDPEFGRYGFEHCLWSQRLNKANGLPMYDFHVARRMSEFLVMLDRSEEERWEKPDEKEMCVKYNRITYEKLLSSYTEQPRHRQLVLTHGMPDFDLEWNAALRCRFVSHLQRNKLPRIIQKEESYATKDIDETWKVTPVDQYVTIVVGIRGVKRAEMLLQTMSYLYAQKVPVRIIVVEQDDFPRCRSLIENHVDTYIFTYSDRPYNRSWAFNCGVRQAQSDYVLLHDADLVVPEDYLTLALKEMATCDLLIPWSKIHYLSPDATDRWPLNPEYHLTLTSENIHGGSALVRRDFYLSVNGMDENFWGWGAEDDAFHIVTSRLGRTKSLHKKGSTLVHFWHKNTPRDQHTERNRLLWSDYAVSSQVDLTAKIQQRKDFGDPHKIRRSIESTSRITAPIPDQRHLHIIYDVEGWAYWHRGVALRRYAPPHWTVTLGGVHMPEQGTPDVVLCLNYGQIEQIVQTFRHSGKSHIVGGFNVGWPRRLDHLLKMTNLCDHVLINNMDCYERAGQLPKTWSISNGVDQTVFFPTNTEDFRRRKRILWIGSEYHAELKGWPHILRPLSQILRGKGFECDFRVVEPRSEARMSHEELAKWYNTGAIYIVASTSEGTPNPLLESASCGLIPVATRVGNVPELVEHKQNGYIVNNRTVEEFIKGIEFVDQHYDEMQKQMSKRIGSWHWEERAKDYFEWFDRIVERRPYGLESVINEIDDEFST